MIALGSEKGMRDVYAHHWSRAKGHIGRGRDRTEYRLADTGARGEMYRLIDEFRAARGGEADRGCLPQAATRGPGSPSRCAA